MEYNVLGTLRISKSNSQKKKSSINLSQFDRFFWENLFEMNEDLEKFKPQIDKLLQPFISEFVRQKVFSNIKLSEDKMRHLIYRLVLSNLFRNIDVLYESKNKNEKDEIRFIGTNKINSILENNNIENVVEEVLLIPSLLLKHLSRSNKKKYANLLWRLADNNHRNIFFYKVYFNYYKPIKSSDPTYSYKKALVDANREFVYESGKNADSDVRNYEQDIRNWVHKMRCAYSNFEQFGLIVDFI